MPPESYKLIEELAIDYINNRPRVITEIFLLYIFLQVYVTDAYLGWDPRYRLKVRILTTRAYHALFMRNMLIVPTEEELKKDFNDGVDFHIFNAGEFQVIFRYRKIIRNKNKYIKTINDKR